MIVEGRGDTGRPCMRSNVRARRSLLILVATILFAHSACLGQAQAQSFDCRKARTATEKAICSDPPLAFLDSDMARTYEAARRHAPDPEKAHILEAQRAWLKQRDACGGDGRCLYRSYLDRLRALGQVEGVFPGWTGSYENRGGIDIAVAAESGRGYGVELQAAGADYTCDSRSMGRRDGKGKLLVATGKSEVVFEAVGSGIVLPEDIEQPSDFAACGAEAPGVGGYYRRTK